MTTGSEIHFLLKALSCSRGETVVLDYKNYRRRFSVTAVPPVKEIYNIDKSQIVFVHVNRLKAIEFLKKRHDFLDRRELITTLEEVAKEVKDIICP